MVLSTLAYSALLFTGLSAPIQARAIAFEEIVQAAKSDPDYRELEFTSHQSYIAAEFGSVRELYTLLRDSVTYYQEVQSGPSAIVIRANKCYVSERNFAVYSDSKEHLSRLSRDTTYRFLLPFFKLIDSIPESVPIPVSDTLWVVEGASGSASYRLEYNPKSRKIGRIRRDTPTDSTTITASYAFFWDSIWQDTIVYPKVTTVKLSTYNTVGKQWARGMMVDSTIAFSRLLGINALFLGRDDFGQTIGCNDGTSIRILSPAQDELWSPGTTHLIRWESTGIPGDVFIEYSTPHGYDPVVIRPDSLPREFAWTVPENVGDLSTLRIVSMRSFAGALIPFQTRKPSGIALAGKEKRFHAISAIGSREFSTPAFTGSPASRPAIDAAGRSIRPTESSLR